MALLDGAEITALRTAAVSGLATRLLARPDAGSHGILGTGVQARMHIDAIHAARPLATEVRVWGRDHARTKAFAVQESTRTGHAVRAVPSAREAAECDIVSTTTGAALPVLEGHWLHAGTHVNLVGAHRPTEREADTATITRASVYVDLMESAMNEAGDLLLPIAEGAFARDRIVGDLGQLAAGQIPGRTSAAQITLFKSLGVVAQDLFAAWAVLQRAVQADAGTVVNF
jgi:ornithine cyclodeaminase/alanine dehydrogenase-like protein (mu-crystallin family)